MPLGRRLFLGALFLVFVTSATSFFAADRWLRPKLEDHFARMLKNEALLVANAMPRDHANLNQLAHRFGRLIDRRVTLIDSVGRVVGDSDFDDRSLLLLENHINRPEIVALLENRPGIHKRRSASTNREELKVAVVSWPGFVRISAPLGQVEDLMGDARGAVLLAGSLALLLGLVLAAMGGRAFGIPMARLAAAASEVARRETVTFPTSRVREIRDLVAAFRSMDSALGAKMDQLARERQETSTILASMAQGVLSFDQAGHIRYANEAAQKILNLPDPVGANVRDVLRTEDGRSTFDSVVEGSVVKDQDLKINDRNLLASARQLPDGGVVMGLLDITELRHAHEMRKDFVANVSHELKTPLTNMLGYAETLITGDLDPQTRNQFLNVIHRNSVRMQRIVDDLLDLARIESGSWHATPQPVLLADLAGECWSTVAASAKESVVFETKLTPTNIQIETDPEALEQVITNLLGNAVRYTSSGKITLSAFAADSSTIIEVRDTGSGISEEHIPRLFERFYRSDPARSRDEGGTGLGLSIVKHLIEAQGGTVTLTSTLGTGTNVRISLPATSPV